jgi:hypothetical protein
MNAKTITFVLMMGVLGNALFAISSYALPLSLGISLDLSLIAVFIAGYYGGPVVGFFSGLFAGILPGIMYGPLGFGQWLGMIGLPLGKALTGLTSGVLSRGVKLGQRHYSSVLAVPLTLLSYVPEGIFTYAYFMSLMPFFLGGGVTLVVLYSIMLKAFTEVTIMGFLMAALVGNHGFNDFIRRFFSKPTIAPKFPVAKTD